MAILEGKTEGLSRFVSPPGHATAAEDLIAQLGIAHYRHVESFDFLPVQSFELFEVE